MRQFVPVCFIFFSKFNLENYSRKVNYMQDLVALCFLSTFIRCLSASFADKINSVRYFPMSRLFRAGFTTCLQFFIKISNHLRNDCTFIVPKFASFGLHIAKLRHGHYDSNFFFCYSIFYRIIYWDYAKRS